MTVAESDVMYIATAAVPGDSLWYGFYLTKWLKGDTVASVVWSLYQKGGLTQTDLTKESQAIDDTLSIVTAKLTGGISQNTYEVYATVTTTQGNKKTFGLFLPII